MIQIPQAAIANENGSTIIIKNGEPGLKKFLYDDLLDCYYDPVNNAYYKDINISQIS